MKAQEKVTHIDGRKVFLCYANAKQSQVKQPRLKGVLGEEEEEKQEEKQEKKEEKDGNYNLFQHWFFVLQHSTRTIS